MSDILDDLVAEQDRLEAILTALPATAWDTASGAAGWTITDVVLHLAQTEEAVVSTTSGQGVGFAVRVGTETLDDSMDRLVRAEHAASAEVFTRWRVARRAAVTALRNADPQRPVPWAATPLKPRTLATTRLAEHWAHGLDITGPLGVAFPDTDRLRHIAWLAHASLPYAFAVVGQPSHEVFCELTGPTGARWRFGPPDAESMITGTAGAFCRVGARRLAPEESGLLTHGPHADVALRALRNYAA